MIEKQWLNDDWIVRRYVNGSEERKKKREWNIAEQNERDEERKNFVKFFFFPSNVIWQEREAQK